MEPAPSLDKARVRILVLTSDAHIGHEERNVPLALELIRRGYTVVHAVPSKEMGRRGHLKPCFDPEFAERPGPRACNTELFSSGERLKELLAWSDVFVMTSGKGLIQIGEFARNAGKVIIQHRDLGGTDPWFFGPHLLGVRSVWEKDWFAATAGMDPRDIRVTGTVQFDAMAPQHQRLTREAFCARYDIDPAKEIVVLLPNAPTCLKKPTQDKLRRICEIIRTAPGHELIIKPHPSDYAGYRQDRSFLDTEIPIWKQLFPEGRICAPHDKYDCFFHASLFVGRNTTTHYETAIYGKPMLQVDHLEMELESRGVDDEILKRNCGVKRFKGIDITPYPFFVDYENCLDMTALTPEMLQIFTAYNERGSHWFPTGRPEFVGGEATVEELAAILATKAYQGVDEDMYSRYAAKYCCVNDGMAFMRVADLVEEIWNRPDLTALVKHSVARRKAGNIRARAMAPIRKMISRISALRGRT